MTPTHLAIVMEYAAGGELFERICSAGRFGEDEVKHKENMNHIYIFLRAYFSTKVQSIWFLFFICIRLGFSSSNLYQESVTAIPWY